MKIFAAFAVGWLLGILGVAGAAPTEQGACFATCAEHAAYAQRCGCGNACMKLRIDGGAP